jgi:hypothetical protein
MAQGDYAVHFSEFETPEASAAPYCLVFDSLNDAEQYSINEVAHRPKLRCRIYDDHGLGKPPVRDIRGSEFHDKADISPVFRRWGGGALLFGGLLLFCTDWVFGFRWLWPSMLGSRIMLPGAVLVITEVFVQLHERSKRRQAAGEAR